MGRTAGAVAAAALAGAALLATPRTGPARAAAGPLQAQAEAIVGNGEGWTVLAWSKDRKETLFAINAQKALVPASNNKVFSAAWALALLGPDHRFATDLLLAGRVSNGVLDGPVVLRGSGDPAFGYPGLDKDPLDAVRGMAKALRARGVRVVTGGVIGDGSVFDTLMYGPQWPKDTGNGASSYAPTVSGLAYQRNMLWVRMEPSPTGAPFTTEPENLPEIPVVAAGSRGGRGWAVRKPDEDTIRIRGGGVGPRHRYGVGVADPAVLAAGALRAALREQGIEVRGAVRRGKTPENAVLLHRRYSVPMKEIVFRVNRHSDNFFAEHLFKVAAAKATGVGSYTGAGSSSARFFHEKASVPYGQIWQADGSGLSAANRTSAHAMVSALAFADAQPWSPVFHQSLAVAGDPDGTLRRMFVGPPAGGNLHAKTGYIRGVRSLSGFVKTGNGETVIFSFIYNGRNTGGARGVQQNLGNLLAGWSR